MKETTIDKIKNLRFKKGYSQSYMGMLLEISQRAYSKIESGHTKLTLERLRLIATILEIEVNELV